MCVCSLGCFLGEGALKINNYWHLVMHFVSSQTYTKKTISLKSVDFYYGTKTQVFTVDKKNKKKLIT